MRFRDQLDMSALEAFCRRWQITELSLFGSALRGELRPDSDVDVLVSFREGAEPTLFEFSRLARELGQLIGREVDVLTRRGVEQSRNPYRRREILDTAETLYAA
jgi:predicted nucleotidyltransferase